MKMEMLLIGLLVNASSASAQDLPEHTIADESSLPNGTRIQINVDNAKLTRAQCSALIEAYQARALPKGQVSVHKPSTIEVLEGAVLPYCVENFDDEGITFNTDFHPDTE